MDPSPSPPAPSSGHGVPSAVPSCRKHKSDDASFLEDVRNHIDEFLHASMEEHQSCLKNSLQKMFGISKKHVAKSVPAPNESVLPLQAATSNQGSD